MRVQMALAAAVAAVVLSAAAFTDPGLTVAAAVVVILVIAFGWPRQMGAPARTSLSLTLAITGAVALLLTWVWARTGLAAEEGALGLFEPMAVVAAWGVMAAFIVQVVRGTGRPLRIESTVTTMGGVMIVVMASGWVALAQTAGHRLAPVVLVTLGVTLAISSLVGLIPVLQGRPGLLALVVIPLSVALAVVGSLAQGVAGDQTIAALLCALTASALVVLTAATAPAAQPRPEDRPVATTARPRRAGFALAMAPVGAAGVIGHVILTLVG
ncbi:MAG: hypothetical protein Q4G34_06475 [Micrococcus sp.]|nr:hypothetical protein [Micrococcus sp.]